MSACIGVVPESGEGDEFLDKGRSLGGGLAMGESGSFKSVLGGVIGYVSSVAGGVGGHEISLVEGCVSVEGCGTSSGNTCNSLGID